MVFFSSILKKIKDALVTEIDPEQEKKEQYRKDITRISLMIDNAYIPAQWTEIKEQIFLFSMMFTSYEETKGIIEKWFVAIRDRRTQIALELRNEPNDFN